MDQQEEKGIILPLEWYIPENMISRYAENMLIQHTDNEFYISFFETRPPLILGTPEGIRTQLEGMKSIRAECVARIIIPARKMSDFIKALQENYQHFKENRTVNNPE